MLRLFDKQGTATKKGKHLVEEVMRLRAERSCFENCAFLDFESMAEIPFEKVPLKSELYNTTN